MKITELSFDIVKATDLFRKGSLESVRLRVQLEDRSAGNYHDEATWNTYISELDLTNFTQSTDNLSSDFVGNVELGQAHIRRAEEGVPRNHGVRRLPRAVAYKQEVEIMKERLPNG